VSVTGAVGGYAGCPTPFAGSFAAGGCTGGAGIWFGVGDVGDVGTGTPRSGACCDGTIAGLDGGDKGCCAPLILASIIAEAWSGAECTIGAGTNCAAAGAVEPEVGGSSTPVRASGDMPAPPGDAVAGFPCGMVREAGCSKLIGGMSWGVRAAIAGWAGGNGWDDCADGMGMAVDAADPEGEANATVIAAAAGAALNVDDAKRLPPTASGVVTGLGEVGADFPSGNAGSGPAVLAVPPPFCGMAIEGGRTGDATIDGPASGGGAIFPLSGGSFCTSGG